jgi:hypothetical protein
VSLSGIAQRGRNPLDEQVFPKTQIEVKKRKRLLCQLADFSGLCGGQCRARTCNHFEECFYVSRLSVKAHTLALFQGTKTRRIK